MLDNKKYKLLNKFIIMKTTILIAAIFFTGFTFAQEKKTDSVKTKSIDEVTITKQVFKKQSDRFVYDVAASPVSKGNTTFDLLKQMPLLSTTDDKTLKIAGKNNALIYINGRKTNMDAESLVQFLKNTPAENIQKIEVITVPGSEYQVESSDGIINIILKKRMSDGTSGTMRMSNSQNKYNASQASFSVNYRKDKLGISSSLSGGENINPQAYILKNGTGNIRNESVGNIDDPNKNIGGYLNVDYQLNDKSNLALSWNSWANKSYNSTIDLLNTITQYSNGNLISTNYTRTKNKEDARNYNNSVNLNYELKLDSLGSKLNVNAAYLNYKRFQYSDNKTMLPGTANDFSLISKKIIQNIPQLINNFSGTVDYIQKFKHDFTFSAGGNFNKTKTDNDTRNTTFSYSYNDDDTLLNTQTKEDPNHFIYDENIYGLYVTFEKKFSDKFSGKAGARYEITSSLGTSDNAKQPEYQKIKRNYQNLLPYLSFNYAINDKNNLSYSFSSRMRRPSFWELNPVKNIITENNYTQNNPFVKAASTYNQELTYMYKNSYFLILNHSLFKDVITQVPLQRTYMENNIEKVQLAYIRTNFGTKQEMSAMAGIQKTFFKGYLTTNFNAGFQHNINNGTLNIDPTTGQVFDTYTNKTKSTSLMIQTNNTIRLDKNKSWFLGVNYFFVDRQQIELGLLKNLMSLDISIKKTWNDWTFALNLEDVLRTNIIVIEDTQANGNYNYIRNDQYNRGGTFSITYNFGNKKVKKVRDIEGASDAIKSRTR
ncbi:iron complex outermembrane receptor protein [Chryseobacterium sp. SORGH_AS909]|uniref:Iron complex outermembrane receptor protein n=2 Tax=Chryseobacterium group TaxID=2782232 RepID=A0ABU0TNM7_9FLAO|nr:iron complex outermembrane receptor protein [Chryseobacterium camelliae]MDQ1102573.1 iron complex outermembrane receptor protein [Chryseobacterium sp. SORGH_AS_1048]MDR6086007.1 iron complex outermembrane receptor protein [Chryseobacterium sp. SORGH_AS_0909]MDR6130374.1 iron complex outermembrane receptor protein [Chryseobacterium sp. SORGH_AS_1175]